MTQNKNQNIYLEANSLHCYTVSKFFSEQVDSNG